MSSAESPALESLSGGLAEGLDAFGFPDDFETLFGEREGEVFDLFNKEQEEEGAEGLLLRPTVACCLSHSGSTALQFDAAPTDIDTTQYDYITYTTASLLLVCCCCCVLLCRHGVVRV